MKSAGFIYIFTGIAILLAASYGLITKGPYLGAFVWSLVAFALFWQSRSLIRHVPSARIPAIATSSAIVVFALILAYLLAAPNFAAFRIAGVPQWLWVFFLQLAVLAFSHLLALLLLFRENASAA